MGLPIQPLPTVGGLDATEEPKVRATIAELQTILSGNVDSTNLSPGLLAGTDVRQKKIVATEETIASTQLSPALATTPDQVTITTVADALIEVRFEMLWRLRYTANPATVGAGRAEAVILVDGANIFSQSAAGVVSLNTDGLPGYSYPGGVVTTDLREASMGSAAWAAANTNFSGSSANLTPPKQKSVTGAIFELAAGSHTVEVRYYAVLGAAGASFVPALLVSQRKLRVRAVAY